MTLVLEEVFQSHNISAVLRSCECFGIQDVHIIENRNAFRISPDISLGAHKWLTLHHYGKGTGDTTDALKSLKNQGYRLVATTPHEKHHTLEDFDVSAGKFALVLGTELHGLTPEALQLADEFIVVPMVGFTESLNISVTAAIFIQHLSQRLRHSSADWRLTPDEQLSVRISWLKQSIRNSDLILSRFHDASPGT